MNLSDEINSTNLQAKGEFSKKISREVKSGIGN